MAVPTTNIKFDDIWYEANGSNLVTTNNITTVDLFGYDYFRGPNGANLIGWNAWGVSGDIIYGLTPGSYNWGNFSGLSYWYDNSAFNMQYKFVNNGTTPTPPLPPDANDFIVEVKVYDQTETYSFADTSGINMPAGTATSTTTFSISGLNGTPLLLNNYWQIILTSNAAYPGSGGYMDIYMNGSGVGTAPLYNGTTVYSNGAFGGPTQTGNGWNGLDIFLDIYP